MQDDYSDRISEITQREDFPAALRVHYAAMRDAYRKRPGLHRYISGSRRLLVHTLAFYLHVARDPRKDTDGLTLKRLRAHCAAVGLASPGMAHLYLQMLRAHRMVKGAEVSDKRFRRLEPTEKMIGQVRDQTRAYLAPVDRLFPGLGALAEVDADVEFTFAIRRVMGKAQFERGGLVHADGAIEHFTDKASGHLVLLDLMEAATGADGLPQSRPVKIDFDACGAGCGVSRVHVAKTFAGAEAQGLVVLEGPGGSAIRPTPLLIDKFLGWTATQFLFFADCAAEAKAKRLLARARAAAAARASIARAPDNGEAAAA